jgi:magnesium-transporting ATPase (P-type)
LQVDPNQGLSNEEASKRLKENGLNRLTPPKKKPIIFMFLSHLVEAFSILLWIASILCFVAYAIDTSTNDSVKSFFK